MKKHCHKWTYFSGMAMCACGKELLPDGTIRLANPKRWRSHRAALVRKRGSRSTHAPRT
jgi:hypothetical protein